MTTPQELLKDVTQRLREHGRSRFKPDAHPTPGPWMVGPESVQGDGLLIQNADASLIICEVWGTVMPAPSDREGQANARLIAAAPEMLDLLREVARMCGPHSATAGEIEESARQLLARIEGGAQ